MNKTPDHEVIYLIPDGFNNVMWCDDPAPEPDMDAAEAIKYIRHDVSKKGWNLQQAIIDRLMLEYCPEEMSVEQIEEWAKSQRVVPEEFRLEEIMKVAAEAADKRLKLCAKQPECIQCGTRQVQILNVNDQEWKCRKCSMIFFTNYEL